MKTFQLDECINSKRLAAACNAAHKCNTHRFPKKMKGKGIQDPVVLKEFFSAGKAIVTNDAAMLCDHVVDIPELHPGLLFVVFSPECKHELSDEASAGILNSLKQRVPTWNQIPCDNSVIVITEKDIEILHKRGERLDRDLYAEYGDEEIAGLVTNALIRNAKRGS